jgi:hypothetical protein
MTDQLKQAAQQALEALKSGMAFDKNAAVLQNLRTALAQPEQEPVPEKTWIYGTPLLDAMTQDYVPAQRKPLTYDEIEAIGDKVANEQLVGPVSNFRVRFARAIEAAHDIKDKP